MFCSVLLCFLLFIMQRVEINAKGIYNWQRLRTRDFWWTFGAQVTLALSTIQSVRARNILSSSIQRPPQAAMSRCPARYLPGSILPTASLRLNSRESHGTQTRLLKHRHDTLMVLHIYDCTSVYRAGFGTCKSRKTLLPTRAPRVCSQACPGYHGYFAEPTSSYPGASAPVYMHLPTSNARE